MARITYKNIYDLITDAKKQGLKPIGVTIESGANTPDCVYYHSLGMDELYPIRESSITIRFMEQ